MNHKKLTIGIITFLALGIMVSGVVPQATFAYYNDTLVNAVIIFKPQYKVTLHNVAIYREYPTLNGIAARIPLSLYYFLEHSPYVDAIQLDKKVSVMQDTLDWGVDDIDAEQVWGGAENAADVIPGNVAGQGVKVAVLDTGIDYTHPDLDDNYAGGYDFINNDNDPKDDFGHGTHCAGIIAAEDNGIGVIGVAPKASLYAVKVLDSQGSGSISTIVAGIDWAIDNGMDIISMSLGSSSGDSSLEAAINRAHDAGIVVVAASGNDGKEAISYPAAYANAIAVGAIDSNHQLASFSNYGAEQDLVAPGVDIYSTMPTYTVTLNYWWYGGYSENYDKMSGTSMATPMVSGACALILSANPNLTPDQVRNILESTAVDLGASGWDKYYGYGEVNAKAAVEQAGGGGGGDTTPPAKVTGLTATAVSSTSIELNWNANSESDLDHYNVYRDGVKIAETTSTTYTDTGLQPSTTYTYEVSAVDISGNEGPKSDPASATTQSSGSTNVMYVYSIDMWSEPVYFWFWIIGYNIYTKVTVHDGGGNALSGVTVYLDMTLPSGSHATGNADTGTDGTVTFKYSNGGSGTYTSTVTDLVKTGYTYDSSLNVETSETLTV